MGDAAASWRAHLRLTAIFGLLGPLVGGAPIYLGGLLFALLARSGRLVILTLLVAYVLGVLPAAVTGLSASVASPKVRHDGLWILLTTVVGVIVTVLAFAAYDGVILGQVSFRLWGVALAAGLVGSLSCALICRRRRPGRALGPSH